MSIASDRPLLDFILCMQPDEASYFLSRLQPAEDARSHCVSTQSELLRAVNARRGAMRLIAFCSDLIVPQSIIDRLDGECFNFHPGPPERPGYRPVAFAVEEQDPTFGVTFHRMIAEVDAGAIYAVRRFRVDEPGDELALSSRAYLEALQLVDQVAPALADPNIITWETVSRWSGVRTTRAQHDRLRRRTFNSDPANG